MAKIWNIMLSSKEFRIYLVLQKCEKILPGISWDVKHYYVTKNMLFCSKLCLELLIMH